MDNEPIPSGQAYAYTLLEEWEQCLALGQKVRYDIMTEGKDNKLRQMLISKLLCLRLALYVKVKGKPSMKDIKDRFDSMRDITDDPVKFSAKENVMRIFDLEEVVADALERQGITRYE